MSSNETTHASRHAAPSTTTGPADEPLCIGGTELRSRLLVGTGKYRDFDEMRAALELSGTSCVTVAVRRMSALPPGETAGSILDAIDTARYRILPNTAGCYDAASAVRTAVLARELLGTRWVKLEVLGDERTLLPDPIGTLEATRELVAQGFDVLVYTSDDPRLGVRLAELGAAAVMPAGSPIGSGQGVLNPNAIRILLELVRVPVIVDAGVGTASDVALALELGVAGVLLNSGIALARDPLRMACAMRDACNAGRAAFLAGRIPRRLYANASSPLEGVIAGARPTAHAHEPAGHGQGAP